MTSEKDGEILNRIINIECGRDGNGFATCSPSALQTSISAALTTVRAEEREAAFKEAIEIAKRHWVLVPAESENRPLDVQRWQGYNLAAKEIKAALEAENRKGCPEPNNDSTQATHSATGDVSA